MANSDDELIRRMTRDPDAGADRDASTDVTEEDLRSLVDESRILDDGNLATTASRILREQLPNAILSISKIARTSSNERLKLDAAKYIVDRNLGRIGDGGTVTNDPLAKLLGDISVGESDV